jgi:D-xylose transport system substrate-binding protein
MRQCLAIGRLRLTNIKPLRHKKERSPMMKQIKTLTAGATLAAMILPLSGLIAQAAELKVGVAWHNFQEERWKLDEAAIVNVLNEAGIDYVSTDAQTDPVKQISDVESLVASGVDALIVLAQDSQAIIPALELADSSGIPIIAYDIPVDHEGVVFISFDNVAVGRLMAEGMVAAQPDGKWLLIEGHPGHSIVDIFKEGQFQVLQPLIDAGTIEVVGQQRIENWRPDLAQATVDQMLTANGNDVDAVLAMNDGMSGGAAAALDAQGLLGSVALSGQDGEAAALNRIARGQQTVTIWKNALSLGAAAGQVAVDLAKGVADEDLEGTTTFVTGSGTDQTALLLEPIAITRDNLNLVLDAGWIEKDELCAGVTENAPDACK